MKITFPLALFFVTAFYAVVLPSALSANDPVLDIAGANLRSGINYHVLPVFRGRGGGLTLSNTGNKTCQLDVVQERQEVNSGLPLTFTPVNPKERVIRLSTDLNIKFSAATVCVQSTVWKLKFDDVIKQYIVTSGGVAGNPGQNTTSNWFKIEKFDKDYKFLFCPTVCNYCKVICRDVGIFIEKGLRRLVLSNVPFKVMFRKA